MAPENCPWLQFRSNRLEQVGVCQLPANAAIGWDDDSGAGAPFQLDDLGVPFSRSLGVVHANTNSPDEGPWGKDCTSATAARD